MVFIRFLIRKGYKLKTASDRILRTSYGYDNAIYAAHLHGDNFSYAIWGINPIERNRWLE